MKSRHRLLKTSHKRKLRARAQLKSFEEGKLAFNQLSRRARKLFSKRCKAGYKLPGRIRKSPAPAVPPGSGGVA